MAELGRGWQPPKRVAWPLESQVVAMGLPPPTVTNGDGYHFLESRLFVHVCRTAKCLHCAEWRRLTGVRTLRITREAVGNGEALDAIGAATWRKVEGGLF